MQAPEFQFDPVIGEDRNAASELLGETLWNTAERSGLEQVQEFGGAAAPATVPRDEGANGVDQGVRGRRRSEGVPHFFLGAAQ